MSIGNLCLSLALPAAVYSLFASMFGASRPKLAENGRRTAHLVTILVSIASIMLIFAFINNSFGIEYVYSYSSAALPLVYKLTGIWAGLDGSLLFWVWLLAICASIVAGVRPPRSNADAVDNPSRITEKGSDPFVIAVLQVVVVFFLIMLVFDANPFKEIYPVPADGQGLNPLLQNFFMLFHPPALYIGYVGLTVPFAYVIAGLLKGTPSFNSSPLEGEDKRWGGYRAIRIWTVVSWLFLTIGNLLGAMWAYIELGWGGFWAWDPVENAGILPWFTATAFLHSIIIQERRGMLKKWNAALVILTFLLTIFGTFITRSGIIQSVHSFSDVTIGMYFIVFLAGASAVSFAIVFLKRRALGGGSRIESFVSREGAFYINNLLFIFVLIAVLWGTCLPLFAEWFTGRKMEVGPPFFNRVTAPLGIALLLLTGIGPQMSWKRARAGLFKREFLLPVVFALVSTAVFFLFGVRKWFPLLVVLSSSFVLLTVFDEFYRAARFERSFFSLFRFAPRRYGGYLVHVGVVLLFIGIAGGAYKSEHTFSLGNGDKVTAGGYEFQLNSLNWVRKKESEGVVASLAVAKDGANYGRLKPALFLHRNQPKPVAEVDLFVRPFKDVYIVLGGVSETGVAEFSLTINPLISFVWLGGIVMVIGTVLALIPARRGEEAKLDIALGRAVKEDFL